MLSQFRIAVKHTFQIRSLNTNALPYTKVHVPVMLPEVLKHLMPRDGETYCDMTFGDGGYTKALLGKFFFLEIFLENKISHCKSR